MSTMKISSQHPSLAGHFPGNPVVPGVVLLSEVARALAQHLDRPVHVTGFPAIKFASPLLPEVAVQISFVLKDDNRATFDVSADGRRIVSGSVGFR